MKRSLFSYSIFLFGLGRVRLVCIWLVCIWLVCIWLVCTSIAIAPSAVSADVTQLTTVSTDVTQRTEEVISASQLNLISDEQVAVDPLTDKFQGRAILGSLLNVESKQTAPAVPSLKEENTFESVSKSVKNFFKIKSLSCSENTRIPCAAIQKRLDEADALTLWSLTKERIGNISFAGIGFSAAEGHEQAELSKSSNVKEILTENPWIEDAQISFSLFSRTAAIKIKEAIPWFITDLRKANWVVSRRGALLQELSTISDPGLTIEISQLPRVRGIETRGRSSFSKEGEKILVVTQFLGVVNLSGGLPFETESYELLEDDSIAISPLSAKLPTVFIRSENLEDTRAKLELLRNVISDCKGRGEILQRVDLRFKARAVVVREPVIADSLLSKPGKLG